MIRFGPNFGVSASRYKVQWHEKRVELEKWVKTVNLAVLKAKRAYTG